MYYAIKRFVVFQKIRRSGEGARFGGFKYLNILENARKVALCDYMAAGTIYADDVGGAADSVSIPAVDIYVGHVDLPMLVLLEKVRGNGVRITINAAGYEEIRLAVGQKLATPPYLVVTDASRLTLDEFGEIVWAAAMLL